MTLKPKITTTVTRVQFYDKGSEGTSIPISTLGKERDLVSFRDLL